jgi:hypothetical protein
LVVTNTSTRGRRTNRSTSRLMRALATVLKVPSGNPISAHDNPTEIERAAPHCGPSSALHFPD